MSRFRMITRATILLSVAILLIISGRPAQAVPAADIYLEVDRFGDVSPIPSACTAADNDCSLRGAISYANGTTSGTVTHIILDAGTYSLALAGNLENGNLTGDLDVINRTVYLTGAGITQTFISATAITDRVLDNRGGNLTVKHLKITKGTAPTNDYGGGAVANHVDSTLILDDVLAEDNSVAGTNALDGGGAFSNDHGTVTIIDSTITSNYACNGGGIANYGGQMTVDESMISLNNANAVSGCGIGGGMWIMQGTQQYKISNSTLDNNTADRGGGIYYNENTITGYITDSTLSNNDAYQGGAIDNHGILALNRVTLSGNQSTAFGGGLVNSGVLTLVNVTISGNSTLHGGGIYAYGTSNLSMNHCTIANNTVTGGGWAYAANPESVLTIHNTIIASANHGDTCHLNTSVITDLGYNLNSDSSCGLISHDAPYHDWIGIPPDLYGLADNGGPTWTMALNPMSMARDNADPNSFLSRDQRLYFRPVDGDGNGTSLPDIGTFEYNSFPPNVFFWLPFILKAP